MGLDRLHTEDLDALIEALLSVDGPAEMYALLQDLCTVREIQDMAQRFAVARLLSEGAHYSAIQEATGASTTTISRVSRSLNYGADGYRAVLDRAGGDGAHQKGD